ncbi:hypothetical protein RND81_14G221700 [Saponaria officinalis]|uniref:Uncharacterized protein n=2 Tax=Saponaria officinalis TaxID=3572 RepID=A0AAW1GWM1_SAPOF
MAELGISLASKLIEVVGSEAIRDICSMWGYKSQLDDLKDTITTIRQVLLDAESKDGKLCHEAQDYIRKLKNAVYDADDLFDEFLTLAELRQQNKGGKLSEKVRDFFSSKKNSLSVAYSMSRGVKKIRKKLDSIASNHNTFGLSIDSQPIRERREETCSYVYKEEVVGRECDVDKVVHMLLDSGSHESVSFLSIVGVGGLGKTTLAQLVFNDDRVRSEFPLRLWTCVSDENANDFDVKKILTNILESASHEKYDGFAMDLVQSKLGGLIGGMKYLIVLDDLWNEDLNRWLSLRKFLMVGGIGSRVLVTTRSKRTALLVDDEFKYELEGLSPENSLRLFEMTAFGDKDKGTQSLNYSELVKLGKQIVVKCSNVPLAIRVVGTLLYGQNISKWRSFQECDLTSLNNGDNEIMSILKLSYDNLESPLKACFTYCSLFPKGFKIKKEKLIRLWMAQEYIVPFEVRQSLEDAAEEYFSILLRRCFFQDIKMNEIGGVVSFRIHDLIHDLAQNVAGNDVVSLNSIASSLGDDVRHIFHVGSKWKGSFFPKCKIRSYVRDASQINLPVVKLVENWIFLRTLDLHMLDIRTLPDSIGNLLHLRYLDLSYNYPLVRLPDSITKLYNLQTLDLKGCSDLEELPKGLAKMVNLRQLDISWCSELSHMPPGLDKLSCLCGLTEYVVGGGNSGDLENLRALTNLRGSIRIRISENFRCAEESSKFEEGYLKRMKHLDILGIELVASKNHETLLEKLEPPSSVKVLELMFYNATTLPTKWWRGEDNMTALLPNLVRLELEDCSNLLHLPLLSKLLHLKSLSLMYLKKLEHIEDTTHETVAFTFFPSLEYLRLSNMNDLKGWWKREDANCNVWQPSFIKLSELNVVNCGKLTSFPTCPTLEKLTLRGVNEELRSSLGKEERLVKLKEVLIDNPDYLKSLPTRSLTSLCIAENSELESFSELGETIFKGCLSLKRLSIGYCDSLRSLNGGWWKHVTTLESLELLELPALSFSGRGRDTDNNDNDDDDGIPWRFLDRSLRSLLFTGLGIKKLPKGMRDLTSLQNLQLGWCDNLECLPEWISCLSSLRSLRIDCCKKLRLLPVHVRDLTSLQLLQVRDCPLVVAERFQDPDGDDRFNLQHISTVNVAGD